MGRPVEHGKREALARRAIDVWLEEGADIPMSRLAEALGVKRPTLLYHFPNRAALAEVALGSLLAEQAGYVISRMEIHEHPIDQLYAQVRAVHEFHAGEEARLLLLLRALAGNDKVNTRRVVDVGNQAFEAQRRLMVRRLKAAMADGRMRSCDASSLVRLIRSTVDGLVIQRVMTGCALQPVHKFLWEHILLPLKID